VHVSDNDRKYVYGRPMRIPTIRVEAREMQNETIKIALMEEAWLIVSGSTQSSNVLRHDAIVLFPAMYHLCRISSSRVQNRR